MLPDVESVSAFATYNLSMMQSHPIRSELKEQILLRLRPHQLIHRLFSNGFKPYP